MQFLNDFGILEITRKILPAFNNLKPGEDKTIDITDLGIIHNSEKISHLRIIRLNEKTGREHFNPTAPHDNLCEITAGTVGGLAHEICHMVYKNHGGPKRYSTPLTKGHIIPIMGKNPKLQNIIDYIDAGTNYDKFIGYLYLTDNEELMAKLTGIYVGSEITKNGRITEDDYTIGLKRIYHEMKTYEMNKNTLQEILNTEKDKQVIAGHLLLKKVTSKTIENLIKEINSQGEKFEVIYTELFNA